MENPIPITLLNDFIFCPASIYFHSLDYETDNILLQDLPQINGSKAHEKSDNGDYSDKKCILQGSYVYCEKYNLIGKIDTFDSEKGVLTERKKRISKVYDGYIFQLYAQYFSLKEMGYSVNVIRLYSMDTNKIYNVDKPENNLDMLYKFEKVISDIKSFDLFDFMQDDISKCEHCIYEPLCCYSRKELL